MTDNHIELYACGCGYVPPTLTAALNHAQSCAKRGRKVCVLCGRRLGAAHFIHTRTGGETRECDQCRAYKRAAWRKAAV